MASVLLLTFAMLSEELRNLIFIILIGGCVTFGQLSNVSAQTLCAQVFQSKTDNKLRVAQELGYAIKPNSTQTIPLERVQVAIKSRSSGKARSAMANRQYAIQNQRIKSEINNGVIKAVLIKEDVKSNLGDYNPSNKEIGLYSFDSKSLDAIIEHELTHAKDYSVPNILKTDQNGKLYLKPFDFELTQVNSYTGKKTMESDYDSFQAGNEATAFFLQGKYLLSKGHKEQASDEFLNALIALDRNYRALKTVFKLLKTDPDNLQIRGGEYKGKMSFDFSTQIDNFQKNTHVITIRYTAKEGERYLSNDEWISIFSFYIRSQNILRMSLYRQIVALEPIMLEYFLDERPRPNVLWQED